MPARNKTSARRHAERARSARAARTTGRERDPPLTNRGVANSMIVPKIVNAGVDSLAVGFSIASYECDEIFDVLAQVKARAAEKKFDNKGSDVRFKDIRFKIHPRGSRGYEYVLENSDVHLCIAPKAQCGRVYPEVYVTFRSEYLWRLGYEKAFEEVLVWIKTWAHVFGNKISRVDLVNILQMPMPKLDLAKEVVSRVRGKVIYCEPCEHYLANRKPNRRQVRLRRTSRQNLRQDRRNR